MIQQLIDIQFGVLYDVMVLEETETQSDGIEIGTYTKCQLELMDEDQAELSQNIMEERYYEDIEDMIIIRQEDLDTRKIVVSLHNGKA